MQPARPGADARSAAVELCARRILETVPRAMRLLREEMRQEASAGLSVPQFRVLAFLGRTPGASLSAVARFVGIADATASVMVSRLVVRRLVTRSGDPVERRRVMLELSARGTALLERARAHARARVAQRLEQLSRTELSAMASGLSLLDRALGTPAEAGGRS